MNIRYPVTAINRSGETHLLYTVEEIALFVRGRRVGPYWDAPTITSVWNGVKYERSRIGFLTITKPCASYDWILRDDLGKAVDHEFIDLPPLPRQNRWDRHWQNRRKMVKIAMEQGLPIPGTGKSRHRRRRRGGCRCDWCLSTTKYRDLARLGSAEVNAKEHGWYI